MLRAPEGSADEPLHALRAGLEELLPRIPPGRQVVPVNDIPGICVADPIPCARTGISLPRRACGIDLDPKARELLESRRPAHEALRQAADAHPSVAA